ncbi:hypothetical protein GCM10011391_31740 [Pullulanibacillus camelliae]|uniref:Uncharacterized protein n=1 Tax=Pullulanibacillus camelliae TaxID=1707096 RepID=A0A8J2YKU1_9BACL|nr:hypothetical protein [Pullulanibacillus camelliae]GGE50632.1 hypothetical protein GCM10011391_31740 [Pullulanibacillus camelliae]
MYLLIISAMLFPLIVYFMPKRIPRIDLYATTGIATYFQLLTDTFLHIELNWYGYFKQWPRSEWGTLWLVPIYLSITPIFLNFYPYKRSKVMMITYIVSWSLFATIYEWLLDVTGVFYHNQWKLYDSAMAYPILFILLRLQLSIVKFLKLKDSTNKL